MEAPRLPEQAHTHLLEAYLIVFEATNDGFYLERGKSGAFCCFLSGAVCPSIAEWWLD
ncbi:hypothetical protein [Asaia siamensis]|uniref:Uncharacterized protein n=1 Tax=Asaia spathodeae TaxID=657016 RepID=A0ABX2P325_9PROT